MPKPLSALFVLLVLFMCDLARAAGDEGWQPPADGVVSEKQVEAYLATMRDYFAYLKEAGEAYDKNSNGLSALAVAAQADGRMTAIREQHGLGERELGWVGEQVVQAWSAVSIEDTFGGPALTQMREQRKLVEDQKRTAEARLAAHEAALKEGRHVLDDEERQSIVESAEQERQAALDEAKSHAADAKDAIAADDAESAAVSREREAEARARAATAAARAKAPDVPLTDEERAEARAQNEQMIEQLRSEVEAGRETLVALTQASAEFEKTLAETKGKVPEQNRELLKKHRQAFETTFGTQPQAPTEPEGEATDAEAEAVQEPAEAEATE